MENDEQVKQPMVLRASCSWSAFLACLLFLVVWVAGWVLAKGFWWTFVSVFFFPYSWYLVVQKIMIAYGLA